MNARHKPFVLAALACIGLTVLAGCKSSSDNDPPNDFAQKALQKHYEDGDMNAYQYQQSLKEFPPGDPNAQKPANASGSSTPAASSGSN